MMTSISCISIGPSSSLIGLRQATQHQANATILVGLLRGQGEALRFELGLRRVVSVALAQLLNKRLLLDVADAVPVRHDLVRLALLAEADVVAGIAGGNLEHQAEGVYSATEPALRLPRGEGQAR